MNHNYADNYEYLVELYTLRFQVLKEIERMTERTPLSLTSEYPV